MKRNTVIPFCFLALTLLAVSGSADTLTGLVDVNVEDGTIVGLQHEGNDYVVADEGLIVGTTSRWYIPADSNEAILWVEGDPAPEATVSGTSNPKEGDVGSKADNFQFALEGSTNIASIDGIDYQETIFDTPRNTFFLFERGGNDAGIWQAIHLDGTLGPEVAFDKASNGGPYVDTGVSAGGQNAYGVVFETDAFVKGVRISASGHDTLSLSAPAPKTVEVATAEELATAAEAIDPGDTIRLAEGTYEISSHMLIKSGATYQGAGKGLTLIDGAEQTRAFAGWGDRSYNETNENTNNSGPKGWLIDGITFQNCVSDRNDRFTYAGAAFNMLSDFADNDADGSGGLDIEEADDDAGAIRLPGPDLIEQSVDDDIHRFEAMDTSGDGELSEAELEAQLLSEEEEFPDKNNDGGALFLGNAAVGTIQNCEFLNNYTPEDGGDDGGAITIAGLAVVTINDCWFEGNYAVSADGTVVSNPQPDGDGGHIKIQGASVAADTPGTTLIANRCFFLNGRSEDDGGAIQSAAVGAVCRLDACYFENNRSGDNGSVILVGSEGAHELTVTNSIFYWNRSNSDSDRMCQVRRNTKFINCTFVENKQGDQDLIYNNADAADTDADGQVDEFTDMTQVVNCLFVNNVVGAGDDVLGSRNSSFSIATTNCLFFGNTLQNGDPADNTQRPENETDSVLEDPLLDDTLLPGPGSPAIDAGVDPTDFGVELLTDFSGNPRVQGEGVDIGADEQ